MYFFKEALCLLFREGLVKVEGRSRDQVKGGRQAWSRGGGEGRGELGNVQLGHLLEAELMALLMG